MPKRKDVTIGIATTNAKAGDIVAIDTAVYPTWSGSTQWNNSASSPITDIEAAKKYWMNYPPVYVGYKALYCNACGTIIESNRAVPKHVDVIDERNRSPYNKPNAHNGFCIDLLFCNPVCETLWNLKNIEFFDNKGLHGQGYTLNTDEQASTLLTCPAVRENPYLPISIYGR